MRSGQASLAVLVTLVVALGIRPAALAIDGPGESVFGHCIGDCDDDGSVTVDEIIRGVRIALGQTPSDACPLGGPRVFSLDGLITAVRNSLAGCISVRDRSGFEKFVYELTPSYGFCPPIGAVYRAVIDRQDGAYVVERSIVDTGTPGEDDCLPAYLTGEACLVARPVPCRTLTADEIQRVGEVFGRVSVWTAPDSFCLFGGADPCLVLEAHWDGLETNDHVCARESRLDYQQSERITALIESLGDGPEVSCDGE